MVVGRSSVDPPSTPVMMPPVVPGARSGSFNEVICAPAIGLFVVLLTTNPSIEPLEVWKRRSRDAAAATTVIITSTTDQESKYSYTPFPTFLPRRPAFTYSTSKGHGRYFSPRD